MKKSSRLGKPPQAGRKPPDAEEQPHAVGLLLPVEEGPDDLANVTAEFPELELAPPETLEWCVGLLGFASGWPFPGWQATYAERVRPGIHSATLRDKLDAAVGKLTTAVRCDDRQAMRRCAEAILGVLARAKFAAAGCAVGQEGAPTGVCAPALTTAEPDQAAARKQAPAEPAAGSAKGSTAPPADPAPVKAVRPGWDEVTIRAIDEQQVRVTTPKCPQGVVVAPAAVDALHRQSGRAVTAWRVLIYLLQTSGPVRVRSIVKVGAGLEEKMVRLRPDLITSVRDLLRRIVPTVEGDPLSLRGGVIRLAFGRRR